MLSYIRTASELSSSWLTVYASHGYTEIRLSMNSGRMSPSSQPPTHRSGTISLMKGTSKGFRPCAEIPTIRCRNGSNSISILVGSTLTVHLRSAWSAQEFRQPGQQPVGIVLLRVWGQTDPQSSGIAQSQEPGRLQRVERPRGGVDVQLGQEFVRVDGVPAVERQQQRRGPHRRPRPHGHPGQGRQTRLDPLPQPVLV